MVRSPSSVETEQKQLLAAIAHIDRNLAFPASREVSSALLTYRNSLLGKLEALEERQKALEEQEERTENLQRVAEMVERETALNAEEKEQYKGFLMKEYFTKSDFSALDQFYGHSYDKLTEEGKAAMSHRVWEGVRRGEYEFQEMPDSVKERAAQRVRGELEAGKKELNAIPEHDRQDFIKTWDAGRKQESYKVLDRPAFAKSVSVSDVAEPSKAAAEKDGGKGAIIESENKDPKPAPPAQTVQAKISRQGLQLDDAADLSLAAGDMKPPLSGHKKPVSVQGKS